MNIKLFEEQYRDDLIFMVLQKKLLIKIFLENMSGKKKEKILLFLLINLLWN